MIEEPRYPEALDHQLEHGYDLVGQCKPIAAFA
jgi:hypothetical protein